MKTVILGKIIENHYNVVTNLTEMRDAKEEVKHVYTAKPKLVKDAQVKKWVEICSYKGEPRYNGAGISTFGGFMSHFSPSASLNISENETVFVESEIFRADRNEVHIQTNKVIEAIDVNKEAAEASVLEHIGKFNSMMIMSNEKLKAYCDIHKLPYEETDALELFGIVFPDEQYQIKDGILTIKERTVNYCFSSGTSVLQSLCNVTAAPGTSTIKLDNEGVVTSCLN